MTFCVAYVKPDYMRANPIRFSEGSMSNLEGIDQTEKLGDYYCYKINKIVNGKTKGVHFEDGNLTQLDTFVTTKGADGVVKLAFVFINTSNGRCFFTYGAAPILEQILSTSFHVPKKELEYQSSLESLESISKIKVTKKNIREDFFSDGRTIEDDIKPELYEVMEDSEEPTHEDFSMCYNDGRFKRDRLKRLVDKYKGSSKIILCVEGNDRLGNRLVINDQIMRKINLDEKATFDYWNRKTFLEIIRDLEACV